MFTINFSNPLKGLFSTSSSSQTASGNTTQYLTTENDDLSLQPIKLPPVPHINLDSTSNADQNTRTLSHLLKVNHINNSIVHNHFKFHNHVPHNIGSAYYFGADKERLQDVYEAESRSQEGWTDAPIEITEEDWREYLGKGEFARGFVDFFEDQLVQKFQYDWRALLRHFLFVEEKDEENSSKRSGNSGPLVNALAGGLAHPLIHLGYGFELGSKHVAVESLALICCFYNGWHKYLEDPKYDRPPPKDLANLATPSEILRRLAKDKRLEGVFDHQGTSNHEGLFGKHEEVLLDYWNAWKLDDGDPAKQFEGSQRAAVELLVETHNPRVTTNYDFYLVHVLTSSHAVRTLLPVVPATFQIPMIRQWWLLTVATYISQLRPPFEDSRLLDYDLKGRGWDFVKEKALKTRTGLDAHYIKALRAIRDCAKSWGDEDQFYLKAAVRFGDEFKEWGGFGALGHEEDEHENALHREQR